MTLALVCHLPGHVEQGMTGAVELRARTGRAERPAAHLAGAERYTLTDGRRRTVDNRSRRNGEQR